MPQTKSYLESVKETIADLQIQRINWAIQEIEREGLDLQWWRIVRKAGIWGEMAGELSKAFEGLINSIKDTR